MRRRGVVPFAALAAASVAGCQATTTSVQQGRAVISARTSTLAVGDTETLTAGVLYNNGTFAPLTTPYTIASQNPAIATVDTVTRLLRGVAEGTVVLRVTVPNALSYDSTFAVTP